MKVLHPIALVSSILIAVLPGLGQAQPPQPSPPLTAASNNEALNKELLRIQTEISQITQEMDAIDARVLERIANKDLGGTSNLVAQVHQLLKGHRTVTAEKVSPNSAHSNIQWESCLKAAKLYTGLLDKIFKRNKEGMLGDGETRGASVADECPEALQLVFLARMLTELELRYSEARSKLTTSPDPKRQELWRGLRQALQNDDRSYLEKLKAFLATTGASPHQLAAKVISEVQKTSPAAATAVVEGMAVVNSDGDIWKLAEVPGINPDFIGALECDRKAMKEFLATASSPALLQACRCRQYADGSSIQAFGAKPAAQGKSNDLVGKTRLPLSGLPLDSGTLRLPKEDLTRAPLNPANKDTKAGEDHPQEDTGRTTFGVSNSTAPRPKIPSWWIRCQCPEDHPTAGMVVDGVRWHAPVLQCPNPELRLRELVK
jgi:hypothetical protein